MKSKRDKERMMHFCARRINAKADLVRDLMVSSTVPYQIKNDLLSNALDLLYTDERQFDVYIENYLYLVPAIDAYVIDPESVETMLKNADYFHLFMSVPDEPIAETIVLDQTDYFTVSENNLISNNVECTTNIEVVVEDVNTSDDNKNIVLDDTETVPELEPVRCQEEKDKFEVFYRTSQLPIELQEKVTSYLSCSEKLVMNIITDRLDLQIAHETCNDQKQGYTKVFNTGQMVISNNSVHLVEEQTSSHSYCDGNDDSVGVKKVQRPNSRKADYLMIGDDAIFFPPDYYRGQRKECICNSIIYRNRWLINERIIAVLRRCGTRWVNGNHRLTWIKVNESASSMKNLAGMVKWKDTWLRS